MDIDLLAKMVGELILDHDEVALPGVGTFVAELMPANFSDKGFTINPPYRKLSFRQREGDGDVLVDFYAKTNNIDKSVARDMLTEFLSGLKDVLKSKKSVIFPGLGKLRATKENHFFFVPDENLNIYPEGFGLESVSLKSHEIPASGLTELDSAIEAVNAVTAAAEKVQAAEPEPQPAPAPVAELEPEQQPVPAPVTDPEPQEENELQELPAPQEQDEPKEWWKGIDEEPDDEDEENVRRGLPVIVKIIIWIVALAALFFAILAISGRVAPELVDKLLYNAEEYHLIHG